MSGKVSEVALLQVHVVFAGLWLLVVAASAVLAVPSGRSRRRPWKPRDRAPAQRSA